MKKIIVFGGGQVGSSVAKILSDDGNDITLVDVDKSVLETLSCGLINIYRNSDFNYIFKDSKFNFKNEEQLVEKINEVSKLNTEELEQVFKTIDRSLKDNSLSTLNQRLRNYL